MRTIIILVFGLFFTGSVQAQVGSSISSDGSAPNNNAMLDVQSPATGDGKGILIPRVSLAQRTTPDGTLAGGLLDNSGNLRGGAAQGLIVYQTDGSQGLYFNTSQTAAPVWVYLGSSTTNYLPLTGGTMSGALNMGAQIVSNVAHIDFNGNDVSVGRGANGTSDGVGVGYQANGYNESVAVGSGANGTSEGAAVGFGANGRSSGAGVGWNANGAQNGVAIGWSAIGTNYGAAIGWTANGSHGGVALGYQANGYESGAAIGYQAVGTNYGVALGRGANGSASGAAVGYQAVGTNYGTVLGYEANGSTYGAAVGWWANAYDRGVAVGRSANGFTYGTAVGRLAIGTNYGVALGAGATASTYGVAMGYLANGVNTNAAIGVQANAQGGTERIAIGHNATNAVNNSAVIRGTLYLDGGTGINYRATFGSGAWANKAFEIDHPLDPENKILRHFCLEGPQVWNVYAGNAQLVNGSAVVHLPDYYSALNLVGSEIYGLTPLGDAFVWIATKVSDNSFVIAGKQDIEVSWTIKVLRNDPGCREDLRRRPVEQMKNEIPNNRTAE